MIPETLRSAIARHNFPQRVLFSGGTDSVGTALEVASQLQNVPREVLEKGIHLDTLVFTDQGKSFKIDFSEEAKKDGQSEYENARGLIKWCHQKPVEGLYRIVILEHLERLTRESPHTLLKLIEEPPRQVIFLFTTDNHYQMLETILSRMTVVRLPKEDVLFQKNPEIQQFFDSPDLIWKFQKIEVLDKMAKENKGTKMDRSCFFLFLENLLDHSRHIPAYQKYLELLFETYLAVDQNVNPRLSLERVAVKMTR